jgi:RNA polymerase sigma-70 factor (ECF subfamily)
MTWDIHDLFGRHAKEIRSFLRNRGITDDCAADLTQDSFLRLMTANPAAQEHNPRAYLFRISRNLLIDHRRRESSAPFAQVPDETVQAVADPKPSAEIIVYDKQRLAMSDAALAELPDRTRRAFELYRLEEMTIAEVADKIGLSTTRTWALIREAYRHIRKRLKDM